MKHIFTLLASLLVLLSGSSVVKADEIQSEAVAAFRNVAWAIKRKVEIHWSEPGDFSGLSVALLVKVDRGGNVLSVKMTRSSGNARLDISAKNAISKASPLPFPSDPRFYPYLKEFNFVFKPESSGGTKSPEEKKPQPELRSNDDLIVAAASGTGFFVSRSGHIITNHHVIEDCKAVKVSFGGDEVKARVLAMDKFNDLAILKTNLTPGNVYSISNEDVQLLEDVIIAGYPLGKRISASIKTSKGSVTSLAGYGDNYSQFQTDAALNQGNSGGPIMDQKGNVVGVAVAAYGKKEGVESFNFGIKASILKTFARSNNLTFLTPNNRDLSNRDLGQLITNATLYIECWMTVGQIKQKIAEAENRKAFFGNFE